MKDLTGQRFGKLVVIKKDNNSTTRHPKWLCQCDCGQIKSIHASALVGGLTRSCGCLRREAMDSKTRLYQIWKHIRQRALKNLLPKVKFKLGDWIVQNDNGKVSQITKTINGKDEYGEYHAYEHTNGYFAACFENEYHIWTIQDAKDGDVITNGKLIVIFNKLEEPAYRQHIIAYVGLDLCGKLQITEDTWQLGVDKAMPATKEQRDLLFAKIKEAGYQWDSDKKELRKIKPHYDISNFNPFDKVLARDTENEKWAASLFSNFEYSAFPHKFVCIDTCYTQCIPFNEKTKHLLGTTDMCPEEYINW